MPFTICFSRSLVTPPRRMAGEYASRRCDALEYTDITSSRTAAARHDYAARQASHAAAKDDTDDMS